MNRVEAAALARAAKARVAPTVEERFWSKVAVGAPDECWPWTAACRSQDTPYGAFWLHGRHQSAPRVALLLSGVPVPMGMVTCHRCDNPPCCNPAHLFVGTSQDNDADRVAKQRQAFGERHAHHRLTTDQVDEIRIRTQPEPGSRRSNLRGKPNSYKALAAEFGVSEGHIGEIARSESRRLG